MKPLNLPPYPALAALPALRQALAEQRAAVLAAPPGSGKTTVVPLALLDAPWLQGKKILMLEPRRVAARASAARMAQLLGEAVGATIGYQIRFERKTSSATRIEVITEGLLTRRLQADPDLPGVGLVIFDEFHERSLDAELALALTLDSRANLIPDLRVLVMSATLDTERVAALLDGAPVVSAEGRMFPVDVRYAPPPADALLDEAVATGVRRALAETEGDILAFLPGAREIRGAQRRLESALGGRVHLMPLYGELSSAEQDAALQPAPDGGRKVILATNIAQTSLTVEGVTTVVDGGWARAARFDLGAGADRLVTHRISRASADQRAGRAGRLGPGVAYRLWSRDQHGQLPAHDAPAMLSADLTRLALELAAWGVADPNTLRWLDAPPTVPWTYAHELLIALGALDGRGITKHGRQLAALPATPRLAHLLLAGKAAGVAEAAVWTAAALDERSSDPDLALAAAALRDGRGDPAALRRVRETVRQLRRLLDVDAAASFDHDGVARAVSFAFPERIARRREDARSPQEQRFLCADGGEASVSSASPLAASEWLAIAHWEPGSTRRVRSAAALSAAQTRQDHADRIVEAAEVRWDPQTQAVIAERQTRLGAIVLARKPLSGGASDAVRAALIQGLRGLGVGALPWTDAARQWQARVASLRAWRDGEDWPDVDDAALAESFDDWLAPFVDGMTRRDHLARLDLMSALNAMLDYPRQQQLARLAPTHIDVPSGSRIAIEYHVDGAPPVLAVKLQELFGLTQTPAVNGGRTPVSLHLLSPGRRPIQVTQDLAGFWSRTYPEVKKELKGRYPKHPWPDDPLSAPPTARAKPRGT